MSVPNGRHRYPVSGNRQRLVSVEDNRILDAFTQHPDGKIEEVQEKEQGQLLDELKAQRGRK